MGWACGTYGKSPENKKGRDLKYSGVDRSIILKWIFKIHWIHLAQDQWMTPENTVMNF